MTVYGKSEHNYFTWVDILGQESDEPHHMFLLYPLPDQCLLYVPALSGTACAKASTLGPVVAAVPFPSMYSHALAAVHTGGAGCGHHQTNGHVLFKVNNTTCVTIMQLVYLQTLEIIMNLLYTI